MFLLQNEIPGEMNDNILHVAECLNIPVIWNFAPYNNRDSSVLTKTFALEVNEVEARFLSGIELSDK